MLRSKSPANTRPVSKTSLLAIVVLSTLALAACGGGGGGGSNPPPTSPANPPPPANTAPTVQAGADAAITLPANSVDLSGSATDAENNTLTYAWAASPATGVAIATAAAAATKVTFTDPGTYTLTLTVNDGTTTGSDAVQVVVNAPPANTAPTVNAGADQTISLPTNAVDVSGTATDAENNTLTYAWTASPAAGVAFASAATAASNVTFTDAGTYTLTLSVSDGTATTTDAVQVIVKALPDILYPGADTGDENHGWTAVPPADMGMDAAKLKAAADYALTGGGSGLIARRGRLVYKWGNIDLETDLKSTTKSMGGIALALALDDGKVKLDDLAKVHLATIGQDPTDTTPNQQSDLDVIKIFHLASHSAGFEKSGSSKADILNTLKPVGTYWSYSDGGLNWLADVLTKVNQQDLSALLNTRVWTPLDIDSGDLRWRNLPASTPRPKILDAAGVAIPQRELASGIVANTNAMGRIGLLYLSKGLWKGKRIISEPSVALAGKPYPPVVTTVVADPTDFPSANLNYGLLWWTNATKQLPDVPADAYWAWGLGDSLIVVIPSLDIVAARVGTGPNPSAGPYWRSEPAPGGLLQPIWNGDYTILRDFLTPISQSVTKP